MSSLPNEIFFDITNFLPNDDITDQMLLSKTFNALVTPRLQKIDQEMKTMNQSFKSFMPSPAPDKTDREWIVQLNLKRFEPIGSEAKYQMKKAFVYAAENEREFLHFMSNVTLNIGMLDSLKASMSLDRFDDRTFLRILSALVSVPKFREKFNIEESFSRCICMVAGCSLRDFSVYYDEAYEDLIRISKFYTGIPLL